MLTRRDEEDIHVTLEELFSQADHLNKGEELTYTIKVARGQSHSDLYITSSYSINDFEE